MATPEQKDAVLAELRSFYDDGSSYGVLSQRVHGLQAAQQAAMADAPKEVIVGALLHDIGWKLAREVPNAEKSMGEGAELAAGISNKAPDKGCIAEQLGILTHCEIPEGADVARLRAQHDVIGGTWLRMKGFDETVAHITEGHVLAKRYLCFKESNYHAKLSKGSQRTLEFQGGPMNAEEAAIFERDRLFEACVEMRRWDEGAKEPKWPVPDLDAYETMIRDCIVRPPATAAECAQIGTYSRQGNTIIGFRDELGDGTAQEAAKAAKRARLWAPTIPKQPCLRSPRQTELLAQWHEKGYVVLRCEEWLGAAAAEALDRDVSEVPTLAYDGSAPNGPFHTWEKDADGATVPSRTEAFADHHAGLDAFLRGPESPLAAVVALLAGERVALYKDKINYKAPGGGGYLPHQDGYRGLDVPQYESPSERGFIAYVCMVAVDAMTVANGCPEVGWECWQRKEGWLRKKDAVDPWEFQEMGPYQAVEMGKGDVLIYDNFMPHRSGTNTTDVWRRALFGIYYGNESEPRDLRNLYYEKEAVGRRANGTQSTGGRANIFHTGTPVLIN